MIKIENCNNISACDFEIVPNTLNIKYAINGTGKSTIAKAIKLAADGKSLALLKPFSITANNDKTLKSTVTNMPFSNVIVFDDNYLKQYVYQKTDLLKDTFEVMLNSEKYTELKEKIDEQLADVKAIARDKPNVTSIKEILNSLCKLIAVNNTGTKLDRRKSGVKSLLDNGKGALFNAPDELKPFNAFFDDENSGDWASWKFKGITSFGKKGICPFCAETETETKKQQTRIFQESFDEVSINYSNELREYLKSISEYIDSDKMHELLSLLNTTADKNVLEMQLVKLYTEARYLFERLYVLSSFDGYSIDQNNMSDFESKFMDMTISEDNLDFFNTETFFAEISPLNEQIQKLLEMIGKLKGEVAKFHAYLRNQVNSRKDDINGFLQSAGFSYAFDIVIEGDNSAHAILNYCIGNGSEQNVSDPDNHLSWGERNAFALLLFMFDAISKKAELIILDDPISSFDSNKKYAIINRLFKTGDKENSLYQRTVLMLTHDFEPVIDYVQVGGKISGDSICAHYMQNVSGIISELEIHKNKDMMSMVVMMNELSLDEALSLPVRVGCLRKYIEHTIKDPKTNSAAYNMLSSLIHGRERPTYDSDGLSLMNISDVSTANAYISNIINEFDYSSMLLQFDNNSLLKMFSDEENDFFKLLILRAYTERNDEARERMKIHDDVLRKYVDETYHIENDYLYSLDVRYFNIVPQHYRDAAKKYVEHEKEILGIS